MNWTFQFVDSINWILWVRCSCNEMFCWGMIVLLNSHLSSPWWLSSLVSGMPGSLSCCSGWLVSWEVISILGTGRELLLFLGAGSTLGLKLRPFSLLWRYVTDQNIPSSVHFDTKRHLMTAMSKLVARQFSSLSFSPPRPGTWDGWWRMEDIWLKREIINLNTNQPTKTS